MQQFARQFRLRYGSCVRLSPPLSWGGNEQESYVKIYARIRLTGHSTGEERSNKSILLEKYISVAF